MKKLMTLMFVGMVSLTALNVVGCQSTDQQAEPQYLQGSEDHPRHAEGPDSHYAD
jgi:hypothetical protein